MVDFARRYVRTKLDPRASLNVRSIDCFAGVGPCNIEFDSGIAVHTGARVASQAGAGEVLVSSTVKDLVAGSGITFADRGVHELKGVPGDWQLFAVDRVSA